MKTIKIIKEFNTKEEMNFSPEYIKMWEGFHMDKIIDTESSIFVKGFVSEGNAIFSIRKMVNSNEEGLLILRKHSIYLTLSNRPFYIGFYKVKSKEIVLIDEAVFEKTNSNRIALANITNINKSDITFITSI